MTARMGALTSKAAFTKLDPTWPTYAMDFRNKLAEDNARAAAAQKQISGEMHPGTKPAKATTVSARQAKRYAKAMKAARMAHEG